jgi:hypothetical protein
MLGVFVQALITQYEFQIPNKKTLKAESSIPPPGSKY